MSAQQVVVEVTLRRIRHLRIASGVGDGKDIRSVSCPAEKRPVAIATCLACGESGGVVPAGAGQGEFVSCHHGAGQATAQQPRSTAAATLDHTPVSAIMTTDVLAVRPDVSLDALTELLLDHGFGGAPVVDDEGRPVGVVSMRDLLDERFVAGDTREALAPGWQSSRGHFRVELGPGVHAETLPYGSVADVMTRAALTIPEDEPATKAAALMAERDIHRLIVVSDGGRVSGIVTTSDVVRWVARRGGYGRSAAGA